MAKLDRKKIDEAVIRLAFHDTSMRDDEESWRNASGALRAVIAEVEETLSEAQLGVLTIVAAMTLRRATLVTQEQLILESL